MLGRLVYGWIQITLCYLVTFGAASAMYWLLTGEPTDHNTDVSGRWIGMCLIIFPYALAGLYTRKVFETRRLTAAFLVSVVPVCGERILIALAGCILAPLSGNGSPQYTAVMRFIQGEAAPYYTPFYIGCGVISAALCMWIAAGDRPVWARLTKRQ